MMQRRLAAAGYAPGPVDGRFGSLTGRAVVAFQAAQHLQVDGIVGPQTWAALARSGQVLGPGAGSGPAGSQSVRALQHRLALAGYSPGPSDGRFGPLTEAAVRRFQAAHRLPANGIAGPRTLARVAVSLPLQASQRRGSQRLSPAVAALPQGTNGLARQNPIPTSVPQPSHRSGAPATGLLVVLLVVGLGLILLAARYARRRAIERPSPAPAPNGRPPTANGSTGNQGDAAAFNLGLLLEERGDLAGAEAAYRRADQRGHGAAASNLGVLLEERGAPAEAEAAYRRADQRGDATAAFNLGVLLEERGDPAGAEAAYRRADQRGNEEVANLARAALLDLHADVRQPSPISAGRSR
jgi:peptidoglycan hydrolase-like protein with peptidoglycan-binding domain